MLKFANLLLILFSLLICFQNCGFNTNQSEDFSSLQSTQSFQVTPLQDVRGSFTGKVEHFYGETESLSDFSEKKLIVSDAGKYIELTKENTDSVIWNQLQAGQIVELDVETVNGISDLRILRIDDTELKLRSNAGRISSTGPYEFKVAIVYLDFNDYTARPILGHLPSSVSRVFNEGTWGKVKLDLQSKDQYRLKINENYKGCSSYYEYGRNSINWVNANSGTVYNRVVTILPETANPADCEWAGKTQSGWDLNSTHSPVIVSRRPSDSIVAHELGHTFDLGHSGTPTSGTYGDRLDVMGNKGTNLNLAKLLDLKVLAENAGVKKATNYIDHFSIVDRSEWALGSSQFLGVLMDKYVISYWKEYGVIIHSRDGNGCCGVTSLELARLTVGSSWKSSNGFEVRWVSKASDTNKVEIQTTNFNHEQSPVKPISAPRGLVASLTGAREVSLSWESPLNNGGASIKYWLITGSNSFSKKFLASDSPNNSIIIKNLSSTKSYQFSIQAENQNGEISQKSNLTATVSPKDYFCSVLVRESSFLSSNKNIFIDIASVKMQTVYFQPILTSGNSTRTPFLDVRNIPILNTATSGPLDVGKIPVGTYSYKIEGLRTNGDYVECTPSVVQLNVR